MANDPHQLIIVRRHDDEEHDHHSSAWKVAHADFMTAMMAFFLIMWLINVTDEEVRKSIANYFNPVKLSASVTDQKGLNDPEDITPQGNDKPGDDKTTLAPPSEGTPGKTNKAKPAADTAESAHAADPKAEAEQAAFSDPYAALDKLAAEVAPAEIQSADVVVGDASSRAATGGEVYRDPFDPVYWQMEAAEAARAENPGQPDEAEAPPDAVPDAAARMASDTLRGTSSQELETAAPAATDGSEPPVDAKGAAEIAAKLSASLTQSLGFGQAPHVEVKATPEGIVISLTDEMDFSMFEIGSAIPRPAVVVAMQKVSEILAERDGNIVIRGYTDGRPFRSETYDNWRLSTARAHMAHYMLTRGNLPESRIVRIEGFADRDLKNPKDPNAAENRRIEILLQEPT